MIQGKTAISLVKEEKMFYNMGGSQVKYEEEEDVMEYLPEYIILGTTIWAMFTGNGWGITLIVSIIGILGAILLYKIKFRDKKKSDLQAIVEKLGDTGKFGDITSQLGNTKRYGDITSQLGDTKSNGDITNQIHKAEDSILRRLGNDEQGSIAYRLNKISSGMEELKETKRKVEELGKNEQELFFAMEKMKHNYLDVQLENIRLKEKLVLCQDLVQNKMGDFSN